MQQQAAGCGLQEAYRFFDLTPRQVCLLMEAHGAKERQRLACLHLQAVLESLAFHAPGRLPALPSYLPAEEMSWEEMKQRLLSWRRKDEP